MVNSFHDLPIQHLRKLVVNYRRYHNIVGASRMSKKELATALERRFDLKDNFIYLKHDRAQTAHQREYVHHPQEIAEYEHPSAAHMPQGQHMRFGEEEEHMLFRGQAHRAERRRLKPTKVRRASARATLQGIPPAHRLSGGGFGQLVRGSQEARDHMARIRAMRG
jgi:hypothetical protein